MVDEREDQSLIRLLDALENTCSESGVGRRRTVWFSRKKKADQQKGHLKVPFLFLHCTVRRERCSKEVV